MAIFENGKRFLTIAILVMVMQVAGSLRTERARGQKIVSSEKHEEPPPFPASKFQPAQGDSLGDTVKDGNCCKNGGTCILGIFCQCPADYTGSHCELPVRARDCGKVPHLLWAEVGGCHMCRCADGKLYCLENVFAGNCTHPVTKPIRIEDYPPEDVKVKYADPTPPDTSEPYEYLHGEAARQVLTNSGMAVRQGGGWCVWGVVMGVCILSALLTSSMF